MNKCKTEPKRHKIGILAWEAGDSSAKDEINLLEQMPGNVLHESTFDFPLLVERVPGANFRTIVEAPDATTCDAMVAGAKRLQSYGVKAITTSCGFNAVIQRELANAVEIPVFSSSLLQVPMVYQMLEKEKAVGIVTAQKNNLTLRHLEAVGIGPDIPCVIADLDFVGLRKTPEYFSSIKLFEKHLLEAVSGIVTERNNIGAIVFECTDLPPFADLIRSTFQLPVFDIVTLVNMVYETL